MNCITISSHTQFLPPPSPWQPPVYLLYLWVCLFETFHVNGIIQYVTFCVWVLSFCIVLSGFIHVVACISTSLVLGPNNTPLYGYTTFYLFIHQLIDIWVVSTFWLLGIILLQTFTYKFFCGPGLFIYSSLFPIPRFLPTQVSVSVYVMFFS